MPANQKLYTERELLERLAYLGPGQAIGGGVTRVYDWGGAITSGEVWVPQAGNRFIVSCMSINASTKCTVTVYDHSNTDIDRLYRGVLAADSTVVIPFPMPRCSRDPDRSLRITTSGAGGSLTVWGWESGYGEESTTTSVSTSSSSETTSSESTSSSSVTTSTETTSSSSETTSSSSSSSSSETTSSESTSSSSETTSTETTSSSSETTTSESTSSESTTSSSVTITYL